MSLKQRLERLEKEVMRGRGGMVVVSELGEGRYAWDDREYENRESLDAALRERTGYGSPGGAGSCDFAEVRLRFLEYIKGAKA